MANRITTLFDLDGRGFNSGLKSLRSEIAATDGAFNKMKVASSGVWSNLQAQAGPALITAGAAAVAYGAKSVAAFQETALAAGKMADATKLRVEETSRLMEVAGDLGISTETVEAGVVRLNRALASGAGEKYGVELKRTADGAVDVNASLLATIDTLSKMTDPTERAAAAQALFGRGYADMAELIFNGSEKVSDALANVSDAKVIDEAELEKARKLREALDNLQDIGEDLTITFGGKLAGSITTVATAMTKLRDGIPDDGPGGGLPGWIGKVNEAAGLAVNPLEQLEVVLGQTGDTAAESASDLDTWVTKSQDLVQASIDAASAERELKDSRAASLRQQDEYVRGLKAAGLEQKYLADEVRRTAEETGDLGAAWEAMGDKLTNSPFKAMFDAMDEEQGFLDIADQLARIEEAERRIGEQRKEYGESSAEAAQAERDHRNEVIRLNEMVLQLIETYGNIPAQKRTELIAAVQSGNLAEIEALLNNLARTRYVSFSAAIQNGVNAAFASAGASFSGGSVSGPIYSGSNPAPPQSQILNDNSRITNIYPVGSTPQSVQTDIYIDQKRGGRQ